MDTHQIELVRSSWALAGAEPARVGALFYDTLFARDPSLRAMFRGDAAAQGLKLAQMIGAAVHMLDQAEVLVPVLQALADRHAGYGVKDEHYAVVGDALIETLERGLGSDFTAPVRAAWLETYRKMSEVMMAAGRRPEAARAPARSVFGHAAAAAML